MILTGKGGLPLTPILPADVLGLSFFEYFANLYYAYLYNTDQYKTVNTIKRMAGWSVDGVKEYMK
ncbi:MAG: hypothetical protein JRI62_10845 [Deltaproteobacteria bacterium]|nr:hypothetical protein [Deltaproteobacteria bacterium]MBW2742346.1 hypothetical protein [Deltaproteobacteria bacterium]